MPREKMSMAKIGEILLRVQLFKIGTLVKIDMIPNTT
jgi:hypothetical protein